MGRVIRNQIIASTGLDSHGERISPEALTAFFKQIKERGLPAAVNHDLAGTPIARSSNPQLKRLENNELAITIDLEVLDEEAFSTMGGFSIAFLRTTLRFGKGEPVIQILINPIQFDFRQAAATIKGVIPKEYTFDVTERIEKGAELTVAIVTIVLSVMSQVAIKVADGFLSSIGENLLSTLRNLKRKDVPAGPQKIQLFLDAQVKSRNVKLIFDLDNMASSSAMSALNIEALFRAIGGLPSIEDAQRVVGRVDLDGSVTLVKVILANHTAIGIDITVPPKECLDGHNPPLVLEVKIPPDA